MSSSAHQGSGSVPTGAREPAASRFVAGQADGGMRLDQFLAQQLGASFSRSRVQAVIAAGGVRIDGQPAALAKRKIQTGDVVEFEAPAPSDPDPQPESIVLTVLHEDDALIVIDKPAGLVVHPGAGNGSGTLVNALLHHCGDSLSGIGGVRRPGIVHRLDKDTSGVMVVAKTDVAHRSLANQFASHGRDGRMERAYLAIVWGVPTRPAGTIDAALGRSVSDRTKRQVVPAGRTDARRAVTRYAVLAGDGELASLVRCVLETGRTHQIRVHMAHIGHPLIGDPLYGQGFRTRAQRFSGSVAATIDGFGRQALHAFRLGFQHPATGEAMLFETAMPADMLQLQEALKLG